jgi:hypothetical protein
MKLQHFLEQWNLTGLKLKTPFLEMDWAPLDEDRKAAWDLYVELLTRVATQRLVPGQGTEKAALDSIYALFAITRETIRRHGPRCINFAKLAIVVLNQLVRPFTTKWHVPVASGAMSAEQVVEFRRELLALQAALRNYTRALASMAQVEDLTDLEAG